MNIFNRSKTNYPVTEEAQQQQMASNIRNGGYVVLILLVIVTGFHAIMIVLTQTADFELVGWGGLALALLTIARCAFPLLVELGAGISVVGSLKNVWRGDQKRWASRIDTAWLIFAACNMATFWGIERGAELEGWQNLWLQWGMPISGLIVGWLVVVMIRAHPDNKRAEEEAAANEQVAAAEFNDRQAVLKSEEMRTVRQRKLLRDIANSLPAQGYTQEEADFIMGQIPAMRSYAPPPAAQQEPSEPPGWLERLFGRKSEQPAAPITDMSNNTQAAQPTTTQPAPGQGADLDALAAAVLARIQAGAPVAQPEPARPEPNGAHPNG